MEFQQPGVPRARKPTFPVLRPQVTSSEGRNAVLALGAEVLTQELCDLLLPLSSPISPIPLFSPLCSDPTGPAGRAGVQTIRNLPFYLRPLPNN